MGWTTSYQWKQKREVVDHCIDWGGRFTRLGYAVRGSRLWVLLQYSEGENKGEVFIALYLIQKYDGEWGYKDFDDTVGLYYYDCPISYINRTVASERKLKESTLNWHKEVRQYHAEKITRRKKLASLKEGIKIRYQDEDYSLIEKLPGKNGWLVRSLEDSRLYRMMVKQLSVCEIVAA